MSPCEGVDVGAVQWSPILQRISYNLYVGDILVNNISVTATSAVRNPLVLDTTHRDILVTPLLYTILQVPITLALSKLERLLYLLVGGGSNSSSYLY